MAAASDHQAHQVDHQHITCTVAFGARKHCPFRAPGDFPSEQARAGGPALCFSEVDVRVQRLAPLGVLPEVRATKHAPVTLWTSARPVNGPSGP